MEDVSDGVHPRRPWKGRSCAEGNEVGDGEPGSLYSSALRLLDGIEGLVARLPAALLKFEGLAARLALPANGLVARLPGPRADIFALGALGLVARIATT